MVLVSIEDFIYFYSEKGMVHLKKKIEQKEIIERNKRKDKEIY